MTTVMDRVCKEALELPLDQRLTVIHRILEQSGPYLSPAHVGPEWDDVIRERIERYDCGKTGSRPASAVFAALDKRLPE